MRTFVVGDIHGEAGILRELLEKLHSRAEPGDTLVFLGDYLNRGPDSRGVIECLLRERECWPGRVIPLLGNHEARLLEHLRARKPDAFERYLQCYGGRALVASYGAEPDLVSFTARLPPAHRRFLEELRPYHEDAHGIYVHAGIPAGKHPRECKPPELLETEYRAYAFGKPVVYGHRPQPGGEPLNLPDRIGLDTGCGLGGPLTALILPEREFIRREARERGEER